MIPKKEMEVIEEHYEIYDDGKVFSFYQKRFLIEKQDAAGYCYYKLKCAPRTYKNYYTHRLVASVCLNNPEEKRCVNHKDLNKSNNHYSNLEWCDHKENVQHAWDNDKGVRRTKTRDAHRLIHEDLRPVIYKAWKKGVSQGDLAKLLEITQAAVSKIIKRHKGSCN